MTTLSFQSVTTQRPPTINNNRLTQQTHSMGSQAFFPHFGQAANHDLDSLYLNSLQAQKRLLPYIDALRLTGLPRETHGAITPLQASRKKPGLFYKREDLTSTRAYKVRGAVVSMSRAMEQGKNSFVTVSTGNHAMGVLKAAELLRPKQVQLVIPTNVLPTKQEKLLAKIENLKAQDVNAQLVLQGQNFEEARTHAQSLKGHYIDPFLDHDVISGQGTIGLELAQQVLPLLKPETHQLDVIVPVGGGGLLTGIANGLGSASKTIPGLKNLTLRFIGLRLADMASPLGDAIRVKTLEAKSRHRLEHLRVSLREVPNADIEQGLNFVQSDLNTHVEGAAGVAVSPVLCQEDCRPTAGKITVSIISGGNVAENQ